MCFVSFLDECGYADTSAMYLGRAASCITRSRGRLRGMFFINILDPSADSSAVMICQKSQYNCSVCVRIIAQHENDETRCENNR